MASRFPCKSAVFIDESWQITALSQATGDHDGSSRRPLRLRVSARRDGSGRKTTIATIEFSLAEACAFSEWLDAVVTQAPPK